MQRNNRHLCLAFSTYFDVNLIIGVPRFHETLTNKCKSHFLPRGFKACDCDNGLDRSEAMNSEGGLDQHMTFSPHHSHQFTLSRHEA